MFLEALDLTPDGDPPWHCNRSWPLSPSGPTNWGSYAYTPVATAGTFVITNSGDSTSVSLP